MPNKASADQGSKRAPRTAAKAAAKTGGVRFAPSPTGRFHLGNLRTAWISFQWAKTLKLPWVVRFEDIDRPRVIPGAQAQQLADMLEIGCKADQVLVQSEFHQRHWELFVKAIESGQIYPCDCSRKEVQAALAGLASAPHDGQAPVYSGICRPLSRRELQAQDSIAWRFRMPHESGKNDFIIARTGHALDSSGLPDEKTFVPAYHWACAIDDYDGGYDLLVRSIDLKPAAALQRGIQEWLCRFSGEATWFPAIFHTALVVQNDGHRLEKRTKGVTLPELISGGMTTEALIQVFQKSFDSSLLGSMLPHGSLLQEPNDNLTLSELGV